MDLKKLNLKPVYYSDEENLLTSFYIPVLSESIEYKRVAGYFCSNTLAIVAKGISKFIENNGKIKLIANVVLTKEDQSAIKSTLKKIQDDLLTEIKNLEEEFKKNHIRMLGWLIKNKKLEIKIAVVESGIEHQKIGILKDKEGNTISFSGSENETVSGWLNNDEQFHVFCSWKDGDIDHLNPDIERFDILWGDRGNKVRVYPISEAFEKGLIETAPRDNQEFKELSDDLLKKLLAETSKKNFDDRKKVTLREYQKEAINIWKENDFRGIFEMATGVGKTVSALGCFEYLAKNKNELVTVICCPYNHLITQWDKEIKRFGIKEKIIIADSSNSNWKNEFANNLNYINRGDINKLIIITTYKTFSSEFFINYVNRFKKEIFIIADEMHWSGAETFSKGLIETYQFRLGLSATPERYLDDEGSRFISSYFGGSIYEFNLKRAIKEINPETGKSYLTPYNYYPYFIELDQNELEDYIIITKKMARLYQIKDKHRKEEILQRLAEKRQKIIVNANSKTRIFKEILKGLKDIRYLLVYCSDKQIDIVQKILGEFEIINHRFTGKEGTSPNIRYEGLSERDFLLKEFADGTYQALVAMKCLDEGVDVPPARISIILASSGNPKEYIQRRGRILRRYEGKEKADIYDILVVPSLTGSIPEETKETEKNILLKEMKRYEEFAAIADNKLEALNSIFPIKRRYNLV